MDSHERIYAAIVAKSTPYRLPGRWSAIPANKAYLQSPTDPTALLESLRATFKIPQLEEAGVIEVDAGRNVTLAPALARGATLLRQVQTSARAHPIHLIATGECLADRWAFSELMQVPRIANLVVETESTVLLTGSPADAAVLESCDLPAIYSHGMDRFGRDYLNAFCKLLHVPRRLPEGASTGPLKFGCSTAPTKVVVVAWSPAELTRDELPQAEAIAAHLRRLHRSLRIPIEDAKAWRPSAAFLKRMGDCLKYGGVKDVQTALRESLRRHSEYLIDDVAAGRRKSPTYAQQHAAWLAQQDGVLGGYDRQQIAKQLVRLQHQELIQPLLLEAAAQQSPSTRNLYHHLAHVSAVLHRRSLDLLFKASSPTGALVLEKEELQQWMTLSNQLREITQELVPQKRTNR